MAKSRQMVFRVDDDLSDFLDEAALAVNRSRAVVICAALLSFSRLSHEERAAIVREYTTRDIPTKAPPAARPAKRSSGRNRKR